MTSLSLAEKEKAALDSFKIVDRIKSEITGIFNSLDEKLSSCFNLDNNKNEDQYYQYHQYYHYYYSNKDKFNNICLAVSIYPTGDGSSYPPFDMKPYIYCGAYTYNHPIKKGMTKSAEYPKGYKAIHENILWEKNTDNGELICGLEYGIPLFSIDADLEKMIVSPLKEMAKMMAEKKSAKEISEKLKTYQIPFIEYDGKLEGDVGIKRE